MPKLWSHSIAQSSVKDSPESRDLKYALGARYGDGVVLILPLPSGKFALFGSNRQLITCVTAEDLTSGLIQDLSRKLGEAGRRPKLSTELSPEDLGI